MQTPRIQLMDQRVLVDRYRLGELIRMRGMARTYRAVDEHDGQTVAVKLVPTPPGSRDHLAREYRIGSRLSHPNLLRYLSCFSAEDHVGLVSELVEGESFLSALPHPEPDGLGPRATSAFRQLCGVIANLHGRGLVHANLSPEVILWTPSGMLKLIDLGHCESLAPGPESWSGGSHGTLRYSSPEHVRGPLVTESAAFVVGALLVEHFTGTSPIRWPGSTELKLAEVPEAWRSIVASLLSADPAGRRPGWRKLNAVLEVDGA